MTSTRRWTKRLLIAAAATTVFVLVVVIPVGGSFLITNSRFRFPERGVSDPASLDLTVESVQFAASDGIRLEGWWAPGDRSGAVIIFVHGLNRSRIEFLERAAEAVRRGYGVLLMDLRNHGESQPAHTTLGIHESRDVCAAVEFVRSHAPGRDVVLWGVSLGASTALLAARRCPGASAVVSDSSFLSFEETIAHHFRLIFGLPSFPLADLMIWLTRIRMGFGPGEGNVEAAVRGMPEIPILFIAGTADQRMPPDRAERLYEASLHPASDLLVVEGAAHGRAFERGRELYMQQVFTFLDRVNAVPAASEDGIQ